MRADGSIHSEAGQRAGCSERARPVITTEREREFSLFCLLFQTMLKNVSTCVPVTATQVVFPDVLMVMMLDFQKWQPQSDGFL